MSGFYAAAQPAVHALIAPLSILRQKLLRGSEITEHLLNYRGSGLAHEGAAALAADYFDAPVPSGDSERRPAGGAGEKLIVPPLHPALTANVKPVVDSQLQAHILAVFIPAAVNIAGKHSEIDIAQQKQNQGVQNAAYTLWKEARQQKEDKIHHQQENIELVVAVSAGHESCKAFSHTLTR